jgi:predicted nucleotidyltransferase component of viral defense system
VLHDDKELFEQVVLKASERYGVEAGIVEKDYYVTLLLREIVKRQPEIIFKGGTSLSKCYKIIKRFSEDIDLNIECDTHPTQGERSKLKETILDSINSLGFELTNPESVKSRRDYNRYLVDYPISFGAGYLKQNLIAETAVYIRAFPNTKMKASSIVADYLLEAGFDSLIEEYGLEPFDVNVQVAARTFVDKIFAIADYYLSGTVDEHSRHLYDVYKLTEIVSIDDELVALLREVREERKPHKNCHSAKDGVDLKATLIEIIEKDAYKKDYEEITASLLYEKVDYSTVKAALKAIVESKLFA